ncbi:hypothetical protein BDZ97DRAFT_1662211 [Flammula alnicola]|nr:hypothetical protein BDZ97DRAFT_1662211 [Flammula alnicola]
MSGLPTHGHHTDYADPVLRPPSPASSVGTAYDADRTSETDLQLSQSALEKKCDEKIGLHSPRKEELQADQDPLLIIPGPNGRPIRIMDKKLDAVEEKMLHDRVMASLRAEVDQLRENELFEQILLRGSKAALEVQPVTNDIDTLMRSMMGPSMNISSGPHMGKNTVPAESSQTATTEAGISNGPWNNFGHPSEFERRTYTLPSRDNMLSGTTVGKRSRNGTSRNA